VELALIQTINLLFTAYSFAIILRALLPWFGVDPYQPVMQFLIQITEPLLGPIRRTIPSAGGVDFSPMVALLLLWLLENLLRMVIYAVF